MPDKTFAPTNCRSVWVAPNGGVIIYRGEEPRIVEASFGCLEDALAWLGEQVWTPVHRYVPSTRHAGCDVCGREFEDCHYNG